MESAQKEFPKKKGSYRNLDLISDNQSVVEFKIKNQNIRVYNISKQLDGSNFMKAKIQIDDGPELYICIKVPKDMDIRAVKDEKIFNRLGKTGKFINLKEAKYNYLGRILESENDSNDYTLQEPEERGIKYVKRYLDSQIEREKREEAYIKMLEEEREARRTTSNLANNGFKEDIKEKTIIELEKREELRQERKSDPKLEFKGINIRDVNITDENGNVKTEKRTYMNFSGTDINTGEIFIVQDAYLLAKEDGEESYMYVANYRKTDNEAEIDITNKSIKDIGVIAFQLPFPIHHTIALKKLEQQNKILELLSEDNEFEYTKGEAHYLGCIENDEVNRKMISSREMKGKLEEYLKEYGKLLREIEKESNRGK